MENKDKVVELLNEELTNKTVAYFNQEATYLAVTSAMMSDSSPNKELSAAQYQAKKTKEAMALQVRHLKGVIQDVKEGKLTI